jgi:type IV pilus assembly protein PilA
MFSSAIQRLNDKRHGAGEIGEDAGFTLIELMVVLLILAILLAIAIPTFLGVTKSANDRAAQSNLNTAVINAKSSFQTNGQSYGIGGTTNSTSFSTSFAATLSSAEPSLTFATGAVSSQGAISVSVANDGNGIVLATLAKSTNNCWFLVDNATNETVANGGTTPYTNLLTYTIGSVTAASAGTWYGEAKNVTPATGCNASAVPASGASTAFQGNGFPNL